MITTNLSMRRPHALPAIGGTFLFKLDEWSRIFPEAVMTYLKGSSPLTGGAVSPDSELYSGYQKAPDPDDLPVVVAMRMSLSFPVLIEAVPMATTDLAPVAPDTPIEDGSRPRMKLEKVWFSDGGISSNFPIHFFDAVLPTRPTFALSLDALQPSDDPADRVSLPLTAAAGSFTTISPVRSLAQFGGAILDSAKDWQDQMLSVMPGQRERIVHIRLDRSEGGLNLAMSPAKSLTLMGYGDLAGEMLRTKFNFDEHRWRRSLIAYEQLQGTTVRLHQVWPDYSTWIDGYTPQSYKRVTTTDRAAISLRFKTVADTAPVFAPPIKGSGKFPRPAGRLRIVPDV